MHKLKNITTANELSFAEIEFLTGKNSIPLHNVGTHEKTPHIIHCFDDDTNSKCDTNTRITLRDIPPIKGNKLNNLITNSQITPNVVCSNCQSADSIISDQFAGIVVCTKCGQVLEACVLDHNPEWKNYEDGPTSSRCGLPTNSLLPQSSLGTTIGGNCNYRLRTLHNWSLMPYKERSLNVVLNTIRTKCEMAGLRGCIEEDAKILYKIASECKNATNKNNIIIRGKNRTGLMAACIFYACKRRGETKSLKEIAKLFGLESSCVNRGCKNFIKYVKYKHIDYNTNLSHPSQYIHHFCEKLKLDKKATENVFEISMNVQKINIVSSHTPISVAAACILLYVTEKSIKHVDKRLVALMFNISQVTLMKAYNKIYAHRKTVMSSKAVDRIVTKSNNANHDIITPPRLVKRLRQIKKITPEIHADIIEIKIHQYVSANLCKHLLELYKKMHEEMSNKHFGDINAL